MIKLFRNIRKKLLSENKFSKYLIYAIGEIVLVVLGILIALYINNKNEERKLKVAETHLINQIIEDLEEDAKAIESSIPQLKLKETAPLMIYNEIVHQKTITNTEVYGELTWQLFLNLFFEQKHLNSIDKLSNEEDRKRIINYLHHQANLVKNVNQSNNHIVNVVRPVVNSQVNLEFIMQSTYLDIRANKSKFYLTEKFKKLYESEAFVDMLGEYRMNWLFNAYRTEELLKINKELVGYFKSKTSE